MFETTIQLKPEKKWRPGMTLDKIIVELDQRLQIPGLANVWGAADPALERFKTEGRLRSLHDLHEALIEGAALRIRPKTMTVAVVLGGLLPILIGSGTGAETMQRIAAPMVGGMVTAPLLSLFVLPAWYALRRAKLFGPLTADMPNGASHQAIARN